MDYDEMFSGKIGINPPLNQHEISYLKDFSCHTRHLDHKDGPLRVSKSLYDDVPDGTIDYNKPHPSQPWLWCDFESNDAGTELIWTHAEKTRAPIEWIHYLIDALFSKNAKEYVEAYYNSEYSDDKRLNYFTFDHIFNGEMTIPTGEFGLKTMLIIKNNELMVMHAELD